MKSSVYRELINLIYHTINVIKHYQDIPTVQEKLKIDFKFKKEGFNRLIIFDLDETLICVKRTKGDNSE